MQEVDDDFQKVRPYSKTGDGGNDGFIRKSGIYYQIHAPLTPKVNEANAAKKLKEDFYKLFDSGWNEISKIRKYKFVFNDKYLGSVQALEKAIKVLEGTHPDIDFSLFLAKDLERVFFKLTEAEFLSLGFNIDQRQAISQANKYLEYVEKELDRENATSALTRLEDTKEIIQELDDEDLTLEYEILKCRCLQKQENFDEARIGFESLAKRYLEDPRPILYLAEFFLGIKNSERNQELLEQAEKIDSNYWLLKLEILVRKLHLREKIDVQNIDEKHFQRMGERNLASIGSTQ